MLKDDFLGIGAKKGSKDHECTGLDVFQNLLGRLNGKSDDAIERETAARNETKKNIIIGERYRMRFVEGGVYVSNDIEQLIVAQAALKVEDTQASVTVEAVEKETIATEEVVSKTKKIAKKRKASELEGLPDEVVDEKKPKKEKNQSEKCEKRLKQEKKERREKKEMKKRRKFGSKTNSESSSSEAELSKPASKKEKKRKSKSSKKKSLSSDSDEDSMTAPEKTTVARPTSVLTGRHAIRHRYIMAKKSAVMDSKALNEIFMVKAFSQSSMLS